MAKRKTKKTKTSRAEEPVPFVIDYDLYEASLRKPTENEVAAIAAALFELTVDEAAHDSVWAAQGRMRGLRRSTLR
jgi:hypothetical protein